MARQRVVHGAFIDTVTPDEMYRMIPRPPRKTRMRVGATLALDATGSGRADVYKVPIGGEFEARRVMLNLESAADPSTGNVALNVAGKFVKYLRSGTLIEYAVPFGPNAVSQIPGVQTWGAEQGPYLRNGEVFQIQALGLTASVVLSIFVEGILEENDPNA